LGQNKTADEKGTKTKLRPGAQANVGEEESEKYLEKRYIGLRR